MDEREFFARWDRREGKWDRREEKWDRREEKWDRLMARTDEFMTEIRNEVALTRNEVELTREEVRLSREQRERSDAMMERHAEQHADLRQFIREMIIRMDRSGRELGEALRAQTAELQDLRAESRAQTTAVLKLLDRFGGPEPGGAAGAA